MDKAFAAYFISMTTRCYKEEESPIYRIMMDYAEDSSVYCRENLLKAFYAFGNCQALFNFMVMQKDLGFTHHKKLLSDGLMPFKGDKEKLAELLWDNRSRFSVNTQLAIIAFITGIQADYLKDLCVLRGNVPDKEAHNNFKIFPYYVDAYVVCPLIGYQYRRRIPMGSAKDGDVGILLEQITKRKSELKFVYQILMLVDEDSEPDKDKRIYRAFRLSEESESDREQIAQNMTIFNEYFLGGVDVLHEQFVDKCTDDDSYLIQIHDYVKNFKDEQDTNTLIERINNILDK